jgi:hypothetical protein
VLYLLLVAILMPFQALGSRQSLIRLTKIQFNEVKSMLENITLKYLRIVPVMSTDIVFTKAKITGDRTVIYDLGNCFLNK